MESIIATKFENAVEQQRSIVAVQELLSCTDDAKRAELEKAQAEALKQFGKANHHFTIFVFESFDELTKWANTNPKTAVGEYLTRVFFDPEMRLFVVVRKSDDIAGLYGSYVGKSFTNRGSSFSYVGKVYKNCGPSGSQTQALAADSAFTRTLTASYNTDFGEAQDLFNELNTNLTSIIDKGSSQQGESPAELAAETSQVVNQAAAANKQVQQTIGENASMSTAAPGVESGVVQAERANAATKIEENLGNQEEKIVQRNYDIGRQNYDTAVKSEEELPSATITPVTGAASPVIGGENVTGEQANANEAASQSWMGLVGGLASSAVKGLATPGSAAPNQVPDSVPGDPVTGNALFPGMGQPSSDEEPVG